jgi:hypothetical protein
MRCRQCCNLHGAADRCLCTALASLPVKVCEAHEGQACGCEFGTGSIAQARSYKLCALPYTLPDALARCQRLVPHGRACNL